MKGTHLVRVTRSSHHTIQIPHQGLRLETWLLDTPRFELAKTQQVTYVALDGELVIDMPVGQFVHLRPLESFTLDANLEHKLSPVDTAVVLCIMDEDTKDVG